MITLRQKTIDLASVTEADKKIKTIGGNSLSIQVDGNVELELKGKHSDFNSNASYKLGILNLSTLEKVDKITGSGLYMVVIEGIDEIILNITGSTGLVHLKELGD